MDYDRAKSIFTELQAASLSAEPNKTLFGIADEIHKDWKHQVTRRKLAIQERDEAVKEVERLTTAAPSDLTDEELRSRVRSLLVRRLDNDTLSAAEIAQLKDVFGLASQVDQVEIAVTQFKCSECPQGANDDT